ncbi:hypothetical protein [Rivularia sp. UHCC 0363]|uniref:hypothetical protein n=1 Tax=Rivularia sp. UHCC 0363 TaxID=3110244 RepID=UPI002B1EC9C1|nr:hypothetical protein [Rivularia sp. UHCC 0363]MEA5599072.1 hypothetical protein [Rivularia sp. UHCC 0363]
MRQIKAWQELIEYVKSPQPSVKDISEAISSVFFMGTVEPNLVQGLIANPQLKNQMEANYIL